MPLPPQPGETAAQYAQQLDQAYPGRGVGASYLAFYRSHPNLTPLQAGNAWALSSGVAGFAAGLGAAVGGTGTAVGQIARGSEQGAIQTEKSLGWASALGSLLTFLTSRQGLVRIAEGVAGIAILVVAVDHLTSTTSAVGKTAHTVAKAAFLA
jgi:hypothetical protein